MNISAYQPKATKLQNYVVLFLMLYFTDFMSFKAYVAPQRLLVFPVVYLCLFFLLRNQNYLIGKPLASNVKLIILSFFLSCIPSVFVFGQGLYAALAGQMMFLFPLLLYFLLHKWNVNEKVIFNYLLLFTAVYTFLEIYQQFTYPTYWFAGREEQEWSGALEERMGFWRFYLFGKDFCALALTLCFGRIIQKEGNAIRNYVYLVVCALAIYFFLARKEIYAAASCIAIGTLFGRGKGSVWSKVLISLMLIAGYGYLSTAMVDLNLQTATEFGENSDDFIRFMAANYFMYDFSDSPFYYALGSGVPGGDNALSHTISYLAETMHYYQDDCGFVGYFSRFGIFGLVIQMLVVIKIIRNRRYINIGLLLYGLWQLEECFFDFWTTNTRHTAAFAIYLYLIDKNIETNKQVEYDATVID